MRTLLATLAVALTVGAPAALADSAPLQVTVSAPRTVAFGDSFTITARAHADSSRVDPGSVQLEVLVAPFSELGAPELRHSGDDSVLTQRVACLEAGCVPGKSSPRQVTFVPARATAVARNGSKLSVRAQPMLLGVATRLSAKELGARSPLYGRQTHLPAASYRLAPGLLIVLLVLCALALLALAAVLLLQTLRPARAGAAVPREERLQRALRLARESVGRAAPDRRRALDLLADVLESRGEPGDDAAERLAWSKREPSGEGVEQLLEQIGARTGETP